MQTITSVRCRFEDAAIPPSESERHHSPAFDTELRVCQHCSDGLDRLAIAVLGDLR